MGREGSPIRGIRFNHTTDEWVMIGRLYKGSREPGSTRVSGNRADYAGPRSPGCSETAAAHFPACSKGVPGPGTRGALPAGFCGPLFCWIESITIG